MSSLGRELKDASQLLHSADVSELMEAFSVRRYRKPNEPVSLRAPQRPKENAPAKGQRASLVRQKA